MDEDRKSDTQLLVQERTGRPIEELLSDLYLDRRHSDREIAKAISTVLVAAGRRPVGRMTILNWRTQFGITRDDRPAVAL
jgi:hypothetical protein